MPIDDNLSKTDSAREQRARRALARIGWRLEKSRIQPENQHSNNRGGYRIIDDRNTVRWGVDFELDLDAVEANVPDILETNLLR